MKQIKKLGPLENLLKLIPGAKKMGLDKVNIDGNYPLDVVLNIASAV